jgi:hypothetical protein
LLKRRTYNVDVAVVGTGTGGIVATVSAINTGIWHTGHWRCEEGSDEAIPAWLSISSDLFSNWIVIIGFDKQR